MTNQGFSDLVRKAQQGDPQAMEEILIALQPHMERVARRYANKTRPVESTADLVQECALQAAQKIHMFNGAKTDDENLAMLRAWLGRIVRSRGLNAQKAQRARKRSPDKRVRHFESRVRGMSSVSGVRREPPGPGPTPSQNVALAEQMKRIQAALKLLPDKLDARVVRMHFFDDLTLPEVAEKLKLDFKEVRRRYRSSMRRLQTALQDLI